MSDKELVNKILKNDERALEKFVQDNQSLIFKTCLAYVRNGDDAADLTQEVFIQALASINGFKAESKLSTWLYRIAINKSKNFLRDNKKHKLDSIDAYQDVMDQTGSIENTVEDETIKTALDAAINKLSENQKQVFILHKYNQMSYKQIAEHTGMSISSIESLLFRAKKALQKELTSFYKKNFN